MIVEIELAIFDKTQLPDGEQRALRAYAATVQGSGERVRIDWHDHGLAVACACPTFYAAAYALGELPRVWAPGENLAATGLELAGAHLPAACLADAQGNGADLSGACLRGAKLSGAELNRASFQNANLRGALLNHAELCGVDFSGARLVGALLMGADVRGARFNGAILVGASLPLITEADGVQFDGADLTGCFWREESWCPEGWAIVEHQLVPDTTDLRDLVGPAMAGAAAAALGTAAFNLLVGRAPRREEEGQ